MKVFKRTLKVTVFTIAKINKEKGIFTDSREVEMPPYESRGRFERGLKKTLSPNEKIIDIVQKEVTRQVTLQKFWEISEVVSSDMTSKDEEANETEDID